MPELAEPSAARAAARRTLERVGGPVGLVVATAPTVAFVAADAAAGLGVAFAALAVTAVAACGVRLARREPPGAAIAGLVVAAVCATVAAFAGEARAFFLPTMALPVVFVLAYVVSLMSGRPLTGFMVNRLAGGPRDWPRHPGLRLVYTVTSLVGRSWRWRTSCCASCSTSPTSPACWPGSRSVPPRCSPSTSR
jgi:hypothetical protein